MHSDTPRRPILSVREFAADVLGLTLSDAELKALTPDIQAYCREWGLPLKDENDAPDPCAKETPHG